MRDLGLPMFPTNQTVRGIGGTKSKALGVVLPSINVGGSYWPTVEMFVLPESCISIPCILGRRPLNVRCLEINQNLQDRTITLRSHYNETSRIPYINDPRTEACPTSPVHKRLGDSHLAQESMDAVQLVELVHQDLGATINTENPDEAREVAKILLEHQGAFKTPDKPIGAYKAYEAEIDTIPGKTKHVHQFKIPERHVGPLVKEIDKLKQIGVLVPSDNSCGWNTPLGAVTKSNGGTRLILNLNLTVNPLLRNADTFAIPNIDASMELPLGMRYFGVMDIANGYWNIRVKESDQVKLSIFWNDECLKFSRLPFGLKSSGHLFVRAITHALKGMKYRDNVKIFVDDALIFAKDFDTYCAALAELLERIEEYGFVIGGSKTKLLFPENKWLGRLVDCNGQRTDPGNVQAIAQMQPPKTYKDLQSLIGMLNWCRSFAAIKPGDVVGTESFSHIVKDITELLKVNKPRQKLVWTQKANKAFNKVKAKLSSETMIWFPDYSKPFMLVTDASASAAGWCLMQKVDGRDRLIRVGSRTFTETQSRYSATEREANAIVMAISDCRVYLLGRNFVLKTDHKALTFIDAKIPKNDKLIRWWNLLSEYNFSCVYIEGVCNTVADYFSRPPGVDMSRPSYKGENEPAGKFHKFHAFDVYVPSWCKIDESPKVEFNGDDLTTGDNIVAHVCNKDPVEKGIFERMSITSEQSQTDACRSAIDALKNDSTMRYDRNCEEACFLWRHFNSLSLCEKTGALLFKSKIYVPSALRPRLLQDFHDYRNHAGAERMRETMSHVTWPNMADDIGAYCKSCICAHSKGGRGFHLDPGFYPVQKGSYPFQLVYVDFIELPVSRGGFRYCCTMVDSFSKFLLAVPTRRARAVDACHAITDHLLDHYPHPETISSDRGTHFTSQLNATFSARNGLKWRHHIAFRPQACSLLESRHRELKNVIFIVTNSSNLDWPSVIQRIVYIMNAAKNRSTKASPFEVVFGRPAKLSAFDKDCDLPSGENIPEFLRNRARVTDLLHKKLALCQKSADDVVRSDRPRHAPETLEPGDEVFLKRENSAVAKSKHLRWLGPYICVRSNGHVVQLSDQDGHLDWFHRSDILKRVPRPPKLGAVPYFPSLKIPLPQTISAQPAMRKPLIESAPDSINLPPEPQNSEIANSDVTCPEASSRENLGSNERPLGRAFEPLTGANSNEQESSAASAPVSRKKSLPRETKALTDTQKPKSARAPDARCARATTRSQSNQAAEALRQDRILAEQIQDSERRRTPRKTL